MLLNISYNNKKIKEKINKEVGAPFTLVERIKLNGTGSPKLHITSTSIEIHNLLILDSKTNICNIELRPKGIIVMFKALLETYGLIIPYYKLNLYKGKSEEYSVYKDHYFIKVKADSPAIHKFMLRILGYKADNSLPQIEDIR